MDISPTYLIPLVFAIFTQITKYINPDWFSNAQRWVALGLMLLGGAVNVVYAMAMETLVAPNDWALALTVMAVVLEGFVLGLSAVGLYEFAKSVGVPGAKSVKEIQAKG